VHRRDNGCTQRTDPCGYPCPPVLTPQPAAGRLSVTRRELGSGVAGQIETGAEPPPRTREDDYPTVGIVFRGIESGVQRIDELLGQRVESIRPIQGDDGDARLRTAAQDHAGQSTIFGHDGTVARWYRSVKSSDY